MSRRAVPPVCLEHIRFLVDKAQAGANLLLSRAFSRAPGSCVFVGGGNKHWGAAIRMCRETAEEARNPEGCLRMVAVAECSQAVVRGERGRLEGKGQWGQTGGGAGLHSACVTVHER